MASKKQSRFLKQQKLVLGIGIAVVVAILGYLSSVLVTDAPLGAFSEGEHYYLLENPRRIRGDKIEIMEFFSYGCIHCYNFDEDLADWVDENQDKITFVRTPVLANESWRILGRTYYTFQELDLLEQNHTRLFREVHDVRRNLNSVDKLAKFFSDDNITADEFAAAYHSMNVSRNFNRAEQLARRFKIASVPNLVVNGKYLVKASGSVGLTRMLDVMDHLIEKEISTSATLN